MEVIAGIGYGRGLSRQLDIPFARILIRDYNMQYTNLLILTDKKSVIMSATQSVNGWQKQGKAKTVLVVKNNVGYGKFIHG